MRTARLLIPLLAAFLLLGGCVEHYAFSASYSDFGYCRPSYGYGYGYHGSGYHDGWKHRHHGHHYGGYHGRGGRCGY